MHIQCLKTEEAHFSFCIQSLWIKASSAGTCSLSQAPWSRCAVGFAELKALKLHRSQGKEGNPNEGNGAGRLARGKVHLPCKGADSAWSHLLATTGECRSGGGRTSKSCTTEKHDFSDVGPLAMRPVCATRHFNMVLLLLLFIPGFLVSLCSFDPHKLRPWPQNVAY